MYSPSPSVNKYTKSECIKENNNNKHALKDGNVAVCCVNWINIIKRHFYRTVGENEKFRQNFFLGKVQSMIFKMTTTREYKLKLASFKRHLVSTTKIAAPCDEQKFQILFVCGSNVIFEIFTRRAIFNVTRQTNGTIPGSSIKSVKTMNQKYTKTQHLIEKVFYMKDINSICL